MNKSEILDSIKLIENLPEYVADPLIDTKLTKDGVYDKSEVSCCGLIKVYWIKSDRKGKLESTIKSYRLPGSLEKLKAMLAVAPDEPVVDEPAPKAKAKKRGIW